MFNSGQSTNFCSICNAILTLTWFITLLVLITIVDDCGRPRKLREK